MDNENYILKKEINWFGKLITVGTIYVKKNGDYWWPIYNGAHVPSMQIDFMTIRNNPEYFKKQEVDRVYSEKEYLEFGEECFNAARKNNSEWYYKYKSFSDFMNDKNKVNNG